MWRRPGDAEGHPRSSTRRGDGQEQTNAKPPPRETETVTTINCHGYLPNNPAPDGIARRWPVADSYHSRTLVVVLTPRTGALWMTATGPWLEGKHAAIAAAVRSRAQHTCGHIPCDDLPSSAEVLRVHAVRARQCHDTVAQRRQLRTNNRRHACGERESSVSAPPTQRPVAGSVEYNCGADGTVCVCVRGGSGHSPSSMFTVPSSARQNLDASSAA